NTADGFVPGVATWHLAPLSMLWEGRTKEQICEQMKDPARNGARHSGERRHRAHEGGSSRPLGLDARRRPHAALARDVRGSFGSLRQRRHALPARWMKVVRGPEDPHAGARLDASTAARLPRRRLVAR